jgi:hypothetical protein
MTMHPRTLDIKIDHPWVPPATLLARLYRVQRGPPRAIAVGILMEDSFRSRTQYYRHHSLGDPVGDTRHPKSPYAASAFRYFHRPDRRWKVASRREPVPELIQVVLLILRELRQRLPVHTGRSLVGLDLLVCVPHQSPRDIERLAC